MRTTITLSKDVAAAVARLRRQRGIGVSEAVNELVRAGLAAQRQAGTTHDEFRQRSLPLGIRIDVSNVAEVLEQLEELESGPRTFRSMAKGRGPAYADLERP